MNTSLFFILHIYYNIRFFICQVFSKNFFIFLKKRGWGCSVQSHSSNPCATSLPYLLNIARGSLTEHSCSHLLWLCYSAESGLITALLWCKAMELNHPQCLLFFVSLTSPFTLHLYYTILLVFCQGVSAIFLHIF